MKEKEIMQLKIGSIYQINSIGSRDLPIITTGKFLGFSVIGNAEGITIELDKSHKKLAGKMRMIPSHMILSIDVIMEAEEKPQKDEEALAKSYL